MAGAPSQASPDGGAYSTRHPPLTGVPDARNLRSTACGLRVFKIRPFARFASREEISGKQATRNALGYSHCGLAQRILRQMRVARRRLDLRVSG